MSHALIAVTYRPGPYNSRRYGKPWIALITSWPVGEKPVHEFGAGTSESAEIAAWPGAVVRYGQKDLRRPDKSVREYGIVQPDGAIARVTESAARAACRAAAESGT